MVWMIAGRFSHMVSIHFLCPFSARPYPQFLRSGAVDAALPEDWESEMTLQKPPRLSRSVPRSILLMFVKLLWICPGYPHCPPRIFSSESGSGSLH